MFAALSQRFKDIKTVSLICGNAELHAQQAGKIAPEVEHYLLAALEMPDGSAQRALARCGGQANQLDAVIRQQHHSALASVGININNDTLLTASAITEKPNFFKASPSGQALMRLLVEQPRNKIKPLCSAHVLAAAAQMPHSIAGRALSAMGVDLDELCAAADAEIKRQAK